MKCMAAILLFAALGASFAIRSVLTNKLEVAIWEITFLAIAVAGHFWARHYRAFLANAERDRLAKLGYVPGVTSGMGPEGTRIFSLTLGLYLLCLGLRVLWHLYA
jgi:hypothetical protein